MCKKLGSIDQEVWFITGATDDGVNRIVAEAVEGYKHKKTSVIGVTTWGVVHDNKKLINEHDKFGNMKVIIYIMLLLHKINVSTLLYTIFLSM